MRSYRILILDGSPNAYHGGTIDEKPAGGIPLITTRFAEQLAKHGCHVTVRNANEENVTVRGVTWENIKSPHHGARPDIIIANNDSNLFNAYAVQLRAGAVPVLWLRNLFTWKRLIKKNRVGSLLKWRPAAVFLGSYQMQACSALFPFRSRNIIPHAVDDRFFDIAVSAENKKPQAVFLSKAFRRFDFVAKNWIERMHPACPDAALHAYITAEDVAGLRLAYTPEQMADANIHIKGRMPQSIVIDDLAASACLLCPGHKDETFCNVAAEATVLGVPVVTMGTGSLAERAANGGGIVGSNEEDFSNAVIELLNDKDARIRYSQSALEKREEYRWNQRMDLWFDLFDRLRGAK